MQLRSKDLKYCISTSPGGGLPARRLWRFTGRPLYVHFRSVSMLAKLFKYGLPVSGTMCCESNHGLNFGARERLCFSLALPETRIT